MTDDTPPITQMTVAGLVILQAKAALVDDFIRELRLYRGFVVQFDEAFGDSRLFAPLAVYDALFGDLHDDDH